MNKELEDLLFDLRQMLTLEEHLIEKGLHKSEEMYNQEFDALFKKRLSVRKQPVESKERSWIFKKCLRDMGNVRDGVSEKQIEEETRRHKRELNRRIRYCKQLLKEQKEARIQARIYFTLSALEDVRSNSIYSKDDDCREKVKYYAVKSVKKDPDFGPAWAMLADLYSYFSVLGFDPTEKKGNIKVVLGDLKFASDDVSEEIKPIKFEGEMDSFQMEKIRLVEKGIYCIKKARRINPKHEYYKSVEKGLYHQRKEEYKPPDQPRSVFLAGLLCLCLVFSMLGKALAEPMTLVEAKGYFQESGEADIGGFWQKAGLTLESLVVDDELVFRLSEDELKLPLPEVEEHSLGEYKALEIGSGKPVNAGGRQFLFFKKSGPDWMLFDQLSFNGQKHGSPELKYLGDGLFYLNILEGSGSGIIFYSYNFYRIDDKKVYFLGDCTASHYISTGWVEYTREVSSEVEYKDKRLRIRYLIKKYDEDISKVTFEAKKTLAFRLKDGTLMFDAEASDGSLEELDISFRANDEYFTEVFEAGKSE